MSFIVDSVVTSGEMGQENLENLTIRFLLKSSTRETLNLRRVVLVAPIKFKSE